jgi:Ca-activated chloride channel family protein
MKHASLLILAAAVLASGPATAGAKTRTDPTEGMMMIATSGEADGVDRLLPLERTDVTAHLTGFMGRVKVQQVFNNPYSDPIEAIYVFPLPDEAAVSDMTITIGKRVIRADVLEREQARKTYEDAKHSGKTAALLEQERPNIFTQSVANILPGEEIVVEITYDQLLAYEGGSYEFVYPMVVGPRYIPSKHAVPDADRITPPVKKPGTRGGHDITLEIALNPGMTVTGLESTTHDIEVTPRGALNKASSGPIAVSLAGGDTIPNKDFVLRFEVAGEAPKMALLAHKGEGDGFFAFMFQPPAAPVDEQISPKEIVFVLDVSGSMSGEPIALVKRAMRRAIENLNPNDTFRIVTFSNDASSMTDRALDNTPDNVRRALSYVNGIRAGGGTSMLTGVRAALDAPSDDRLRIVVFMSDGYIGNEAEILAAIGESLGDDTRIFPFGVGSSVNRYLLDRMAGVGRGAATYVLLDDDPAEQVAAFYARIANPVLTHIEIDWAGLAVAQTTPSAVPDLFAGQPVWVVGRYDSPGKAKVRVKGKLGGRDVSYDVPVALPRSDADNAALAQLWARERVKQMMSAMYGGEDPELVQQVTQLGLDYRIATRYTSFVAVEERVVNEGGQVKTVRVPVEMPEGVSYDAVYGAGGAGGVVPGRTYHSNVDTADYDEAGSYVSAPGVAVARREMLLEPRRWSFGASFGFGSVDLGDDEGANLTVWTLRVSRALSPRLGFGAHVTLARPNGNDADRRWTNALVETIYMPVSRLALLAGFGAAIPKAGDLGIGYYAGAQVRLIQLGGVTLGLDLRLDGATATEQDANSLSAGFSLSY